MTGFPAINSRDQVVFTMATNDGERAAFYDGASVRDITRAGVASVHAAGLNNAGQVAGFTYDSAGNSRAFVWTQAGGMVDIPAMGGASAKVAGISSTGRVIGWLEPALAPPRAFRWSATDGMEDLGSLTGGGTTAVAINDAGLITGDSDAADGMTHAFAWTREGGMVDLGTMGGDYAYSTAVAAKGEVTGYANTRRGNYESNRAFLWTPGGKLQNLGAAGGTESFPLAMSSGAQVAGVLNLANGNQHAFSWTRGGGMVDLGTLGGASSRALAVNNNGLVGGTALAANGEWRGFIWTAANRMVDLNSRLQRAPKGLVIDAVVAISDSGAIVATANTGLVLLQPVPAFWVGPASGPAVGPLAAATMVTVGAPIDASVSLAGDDTAPGVSWSWGDGSAPESVAASAGSGSGSGRHVFRAAGIYDVAATVTDRTGKRASASREVIVYDPATGVVGGSGWFMSPQGADKHVPVRSQKARFSFAAPARGTAGAQAGLRFTVGELNLRSTELRLVSAQGGQALFEGRGTVNGAGNYRFTATATAGARGAGRFAIRLWHADPASKRDVVDYDNTSGKAVATLADGSIAMR